MLFHKLYLHQFRCYQKAEFSFSPSLNVICGVNALGKTSILEAIYFLMTGRSFRTPNTSDLIQINASGFFLEAQFSKFQIHQRLKASVNAQERTFLYNDTSYTSTTNLLGILQGVLMAPSDVAIVKGGPTHRRQYLDMQIAQVDPLYIHHFTRYQRALKQRNTLLRYGRQTAIESWEYEMARSADYITKQRREALSDLQARGNELYTFLSGEAVPLTLRYESKAPEVALSDYYVQQFAAFRKRELKLGFTMIGPHKEDMSISIGDRDVRYHSSEGEQRSCVIALRLAEWQRMQQLTGDKPLLLIDDIGVGLDALRQQRLFECVGQMGQSLLTTTQRSGFDQAHLIELKRG